MSGKTVTALAFIWVLIACVAQIVHCTNDIEHLLTTATENFTEFEHRPVLFIYGLRDRQFIDLRFAVTYPVGEAELFPNATTTNHDYSFADGSFAIPFIVNSSMAIHFIDRGGSVS